MLKISILTPSFNTGKYLERAIQSVLKQDYSNWEHIVMDGGSTDNTLEVLKKYPHLIWKSEKDQGQSDAMNKAFKISTGDVIVYLNADDYFEKNAFGAVMQTFAQDNAADIVVGNGININVAAGTRTPWNSDTSYRRLLQFYNCEIPQNPVSYFYKRKVQEKVSYNVNNHYSMDYEFLLRAFQLFKVKKIERVLGYFFEDGTNKSSDGYSYGRLKKTSIQHCMKHDKFSLFVFVPWFIKRKILRQGK